jgi:hypothetical protein
MEWPSYAPITTRMIGFAFYNGPLFPKLPQSFFLGVPGLIINLSK